MANTSMPRAANWSSVSPASISRTIGVRCLPEARGPLAGDLICRFDVPRRSGESLLQEPLPELVRFRSGVVPLDRPRLGRAAAVP